MNYTIIFDGSRVSPATRADFKRRQNLQNQYETARRHRSLYLLKQRLLGLALIALTVISAIVMDGDITIGVLLIPLGLGLIFSKSQILDIPGT